MDILKEELDKAKELNVHEGPGKSEVIKLVTKLVKKELFEDYQRGMGRRGQY
jgi:hypothetical protein